MGSLGLTFTAVAVASACYNSEVKDPSSETTTESTATATVEKKPIKVEDTSKHNNDTYDKEQTEIVLNRATRLVNDNCGLTKDPDGKATGPWGQVTIKLTLGHNGHMKAVKVPSPYDGKPVGSCIVKAFENLVFPPWAGADAEDIEWTVELHPPPK